MLAIRNRFGNSIPVFFPHFGNQARRPPFFGLLLRITGLGDISVNHIIGQEAKYFISVQNFCIVLHKNESIFCQTSGRSI